MSYNQMLRKACDAAMSMEMLATRPSTMCWIAATPGICEHATLILARA